MDELVPRVVVGVLVAVHLFLAAWTLVGLAEFFASQVPWRPISNPLFPPWMLLAQWLAILPTAIVFLAGYALGWQYMPHALGVGYAAMAGLCAYQTVYLLKHDTRFLAMAAEYVAYIAILVFLLKSNHVRQRLGGAG